MYLPPDNLAYYSVARVESHFIGVSGDDTRAGSGTGFVIRKGILIFFVTNRHNVDYDYKKGKRTGYKLKSVIVNGWISKQPGMLHKYEAKLEADRLNFVFPVNDSEDVAVARFLGIGAEGVCAFDFGTLGDEDDFSKTIPGEPTLMYGYSELMNAHTGAPIVRSGIVASDPSHDYRQASDSVARRVAVEAMSTQGMSGSPVYALQRGFEAGVGLKFEGYRRGYLLGINCAHYHESDEKLITVHGHVSACIKSSVIAELIELTGRS